MVDRTNQYRPIAPTILGAKNISQVFSIFRDGVISDHQQIGGDISLTIEIAYLAKTIDPGYDRFLVTLRQMRDLRLISQPWDLDQASKALADPKIIFEPELEIASCSATENTIRLICNQYAASIEHCGGELNFAARSATVTDQGMRNYTMQELKKLHDNYWDV